MNDRNVENLIPTPCHQKWEDMGEDETMQEGHTARMCDECQHHVHDISDMSSEQIIDLKTKLNQQGQKLCGMVRQPSSSKLQRFSLVCIAAMAPIALVACGGSSYPTSPPRIEQPTSPHQIPTQKPRPYFPPGVLGKVAAPQQVAGTVVDESDLRVGSVATPRNNPLDR